MTPPQAEPKGAEARFVLTGEIREPKIGEWYWSHYSQGFLERRRKDGDFTNVYPIAVAGGAK